MNGHSAAPFRSHRLQPVIVGVEPLPMVTAQFATFASRDQRGRFSAQGAVSTQRSATRSMTVAPKVAVLPWVEARQSWSALPHR
jgi:hypothetical protein